MAAGHDVHDELAHGHDDHGHGHDDHGDHGSGGDAWVLIPIAVGLIIGLVILVALGLASDAAPFV